MKPSKYRNVKTVVDGFKFDSKAESKRYLELNLLQQAGVIFGLQMQIKYTLIARQKRADGVRELPVFYVADFQYFEKGKLVVEDVKGVKTPVYIVKRKLMLEKHGITIKEVTK
jgi:hypothetical protein